MTIIWYIVPKIWSATDRIFSHVAPFFALYPTNNTKIKILRKWKNTWKYHHFTHVYLNYNYMMYDCWDMKRDRQRFFVILDHSLPFYPTNNPKLQPWIYHHFEQVYENHDHMLYRFWDMACDVWNYYFSFWAIFCPFTSLTAQKSKI